MPTREWVIIHNIETNSNEDDEPIAAIAKKRRIEKKSKEPYEEPIATQPDNQQEATREPMV